MDSLKWQALLGGSGMNITKKSTFSVNMKKNIVFREKIEYCKEETKV